LLNQVAQQIFEKTSFPMLVLDEHSKILHANSAANSMLEKDNLFQVGSSIDDYLSDSHPLIEQEVVIESLGMRQYWQGHRRLSDSPDFSWQRVAHQKIDLSARMLRPLVACTGRTCA